MLEAEEIVETSPSTFCKKTYIKHENIHCRFCAACKTNEELLDLASDTDTLEHCMKIIKFFQIDYLDLTESTNLPRVACERCYDFFVDAYDYFCKVKDSQVLLNDIYNINVENFTSDVKVETILDADGIETSVENSQGVVTESCALLKDTSACVPKNELINENDPTHDCDDTSDCVVGVECDLESLRSQEKVKPVLYSGIPVFTDHGCSQMLETYENSSTDVTRDIDFTSHNHMSWATYPWLCTHCGKSAPSMDELRQHSKDEHNMCYAFHCADCTEQFNTFNAFVEHVRYHREKLDLYCQYCNAQFPDQRQCIEHASSHWLGPKCICELCGEMLASAAALDRHKRVYKRRTLPRKYRRKRPRRVDGCLDEVPLTKTWHDYEWICQECFLKTSDVDTLRSHVQEIHKKCFAFKCADCLKVMKSYMMFLKHVRQHRPYLKHYCPYCNAFISDQTILSQHVSQHFESNPRPCEGCGQVLETSMLTKHMKEFDSPRRRGTLTPDDLTCDICQKMFNNLRGLRSHKAIHEKREREYTCDQCGKAFYSQNNLTEHMKRHSSAKEVCQICNKSFHTRHNLRQHVATHSSLRPYVCNACGKGFRTKKHLYNHLKCHSDLKPFRCKVCSKQFKFSSHLKSHEHVHTGAKPFSCEYCEKTFRNWANCNKHMIRKHGVTLAQTKLTSLGRLTINRLTGKPRKVATGEDAKVWMEKMLETRSVKKKDRIAKK